MEILAMTCLLLGFISLIWMGWIDLKLWILPNELVLLFAILALPFHFATGWFFGGWLYCLMGGVIGAGALLLVRGVANKIYGFETMGLGDVKLMGAAGLWLGPEGILIALSVGAFCGVVHAVTLAIAEKKSLNRMMLPAGPGFIAGILIIGFYTLKDYYI